MSLYTHTFAAGETFDFGEGVNFEIVSAPFPVSVEIRKDNRVLERATNAPRTYYVRTPFDQVRVTSVLAQTVTVDVSNSVAGVRTSEQAVEVIPTARAAAGNFYINSMSIASPGNFACFRIENVSTGIDYVIESIKVQCAAGAGTIFGGELADLFTHTPNIDFVNKLAGGPVIANAMQVTSFPAAVTTGPLHHVLNGAGSEYLLAPDEAQVILQPGEKMYWTANATGSAASSVVQMFTRVTDA